SRSPGTSPGRGGAWCDDRRDMRDGRRYCSGFLPRADYGEVMDDESKDETPTPPDEGDDASTTSGWSARLDTVSTPTVDTPLTRTGIAGCVLALVAFLGMAFLAATIVAAAGILLSVHGLIEVRNGKRRGIAYPAIGIGVGSIAFLATLLLF